MRPHHLFLTLTLLVVPALPAHAQNMETQWLGEAPFCQAQKSQCSAKSMTFVRKHPSGDGETCLTGYKVLCEGAAITSTACPTSAYTLNKVLNCNCSADKTKHGTIYGTTDYTADSNICRAAVHAGVIPSAGGRIKVTPRPGLKSYRSTTANGINSKSWGPYRAGFRVSK